MVGTKHKRLIPLRRYSLKILFVLIISAIATSAYAHEPLFSLGPGTIYKGGIGVNMGIEGKRASNSNIKDKELSLYTNIMYGITENLSVILATPLIIKKSYYEGSEEYTNSGIGDISLKTKYRFWNYNSPGTNHAAAFVIGIKLPTGEDWKIPKLGTGPTDFTGEGRSILKLGTGSTDFIFGLTTARASLSWYYFGDIRYRLNTVGNDNLKKGNRAFADLATGIHAWAPKYLKPDLVLIAELNWELLMRDKLGGVDIANSGGNRLFFSPSFFLTYRNWAIRSGIQIPLSQNLYGNQPEDKYRFKINVEVHL